MWEKTCPPVEVIFGLTAAIDTIIEKPVIFT
jgi:hypothetical protein